MKFSFNNALAVAALSFPLFTITKASYDHSEHDQGHHYHEQETASAESDLGPAVYTHSLSTPFLHSEFDNEWWDFGGKIIDDVSGEI